MKETDITTVFFALLRAGLWEEEVRLSAYSPIHLDALFKMADEQSVVGIVAAGINHVADMHFPKQEVMPFVGHMIQLEQENLAMNAFIANMVKSMQEDGINALLIKGQGIAQCYEKPLWRSIGDVDLFMNDNDYEKAKVLLIPLSSSIEKEGKSGKHLGRIIELWVVELHGTLRCGFSKSANAVLDQIKEETFSTNKVRFWDNKGVSVPLLDTNNDIIFVFTHFLNHFYKEGIVLRQICDWCRLLWTYRDEIDVQLIERRIKNMGLVSEWKAFGALAIEYLGFPKDYMPLLDVRSKKEDVRWRKKAVRIMDFILKSGNMGHDYFSKTPYLIRKSVSMGRRIDSLINHSRIFPLDSLRFFPHIMYNGIMSAMRGE